MPRHWPSGQPPFSRRSAGTAGAGGEKAARLKGSSGPLRTELAENSPQPAQPLGGRQAVDCSLRFAASKPALCQGPPHHTRKASETETPSSDRPPAWGIGRDAGARFRDALQPPRLVWEGLEGATRPSMSMPLAATGLAIGWGFPPRGSHANFETVGGEFA